jgi:hypothetical protein
MAFIRLDAQTVLLATVTEGDDWRYRRVRLPPDIPINAALRVSATGTKLLLWSDNTAEPVVMDLTLPDRDAVTAPAHSLPMERFQSTSDGRLLEWRDGRGGARGATRELHCGDQPRWASGLSTGGTICIADDGTLTERHDDGAIRHVGTISGARRWRLYEADGIAHLIGMGSESVHYVISSTELSQLPSETSSARLYLKLHSSSNGVVLTSVTLDSLCQQLERGARRYLGDHLLRTDVGAEMWTFQRLVPDDELYAPVLAMAKDEPILPADVGSWWPENSSEPITHDEWLDMLDQYQRLRPDAKRLCTIYRRIWSYPGSWVFEYWLYFPFDVGGVGSHLHDSEHAFVEVDKLGGQVNQILAAAHGRTTSNNIYKANLASSVPVRLPILIVVERGKHALAPDINKDGVITPGYDINTEPERALGVGHPRRHRDD